MKRVVLAIGDLMMTPRATASSIQRFILHSNILDRRNINFRAVTYDDLLSGRLPLINSRNLKIILFFPYTYWNNYIERYDRDERIYGDGNFGYEYKRFFARVSKTLRSRYRNNKLSFVNPPLSCGLDRDKGQTYKELKKTNIPTPRAYKISDIAQIDKLLNKGRELYIKPVFGSMGKGITYLNRKDCYTNFIFKDGKIISRQYDYNWPFRRIAKQKRDIFLRILIEKGFLFQEAVNAAIYRRKRFDLRIYVINNQIPYLYAKSSPGDYFLTNWSQGGRIEDPIFLKRALEPNIIEKVKKTAKQATRALSLNYAGVDIIVDREKRKVYALEIHSFPDYERGYDLMKFLAHTI